MDNKKHTINRKHEQLSDAAFSKKNGLPAAVRSRRRSEWPETSVKHSMSKKRSVFVPDLLCLLRMERGVVAEFTLFNCSMGGLFKTAYVDDITNDSAEEQSQRHSHKFMVFSVKRGSLCRQESFGRLRGCGGLPPILTGLWAL